MSGQLPGLAGLTSVVSDRHGYARQWKEKTEGKVMGYLCTYAPEELLYAAHILPTRIVGTHEPQSVTEPYIFGMYCPFCRDCLAQGLQGRYDYLDGVLIAQSCLHIRQTWSCWKKYVLPEGQNYYLPFPNNVSSPSAVPYLTQELAVYKKGLEEWLGQEITDDALDHAIETYNTNRRLMHAIYAFRKQEKPPLTGKEAMIITLAGQMMDKEEHNKALTEILAALPDRNLDRDTGVRLMIVGSEDDDIAFLNMVEEDLNATVVVDDHCTGTRYFWNEVPAGENRLEAIARRYVERPRCPSKDWFARTRFEHIGRLAREYNVAGALLIQQKFCDPHEADIPPLQKYLEDNGIRTYFLEFDLTVPLGQFKIRIEAFLEMIQAEDLF